MTIPGPSKLRQRDQLSGVGSGKSAAPQLGRQVFGGRQSSSVDVNRRSPTALGVVGIALTRMGSLGQRNGNGSEAVELASGDENTRRVSRRRYGIDARTSNLIRSKTCRDDGGQAKLASRKVGSCQRLGCAQLYDD